VTLPSPESAKPSHPKPRRPIRILLVDHEAQVRQTIADAIDTDTTAVVEAATLEQANLLMEQGPIDVALVNSDLPDGSALQLAGDLKRKQQAAQTIMMSEQADVQQAVDSMRAGASDLIARPVNLNELNERLGEAIERYKSDAIRMHRLRRLRRLCKKLNQARLDVSRQVDILCTDLVTAYQELAHQVADAALPDELAAELGNDLDLETVLKRTLEHLLSKIGPTNAAIFMPSPMEGYTLGGYVNYNCDKGTADMLLQHLADVVAPRVAEQLGPVHFTDNAALHAWIGDDATYLEDCHVMAVPCIQDGEVLAVVVLFRDASEPFHQQLHKELDGFANTLGMHLAKIVRVHYRHLPDYDAADGDEG